MNTIKIDTKGVKMVAHRGVSGLETENTIPAFVAAGNRTYYGVETDVYVTTDGKFVIHHDASFLRTAGEDLKVGGSSFDLARRMRLKDLQVPGLKRDDLVPPTLAEYILICKKYDKKCVLEIKFRENPEALEKMVEEIKALDYLDGVIFISFHMENMIKLRELLPEQPLQFLTVPYNQEILANLDKYNLDLDIMYRTLTKEIMDEVHAHGHLVNGWTCDVKEDAERLVEWGIDFITTNIVE